jgi:hypothetical protein
MFCSTATLWPPSKTPVSNRSGHSPAPSGISATECNLVQWGARLRHISATFCNAVQCNLMKLYIIFPDSGGTLPTVYTVACQRVPFESRPLVTRNTTAVTIMPKYILSLMLFYLSMRNHTHLCTGGHDNAEQSVSDAWEKHAGASVMRNSALKLRL